MTKTKGRRRNLGILGVLLPSILFVCPRVFASDPALDISQYAHTAWKLREGFTKGQIFPIAQTPDGYLWLGTEFGLFRFDGVRPVPWRPPSGQHLPSDYIRSLLVTRDGTLWIGTSKGLESWKDGKLTQYAELDGRLIFALLEDREGVVWASGYAAPTGRLCAIRSSSSVQCYGEDGALGRGAFNLYEDSKGSLWVAAQTGLWRWKPGRREQYTFPRGVTEANSLVERGDGALLLATNDGLKQVIGGRIQGYALPGVTGKFRPTFLFRSSDGSLWIGSFQGLLHLHEGKTDTFLATDGLSSDSVLSIFEDREGSVWVTTVNGLDRFREYAIPSVSRNQGLSNNGAYSIQATLDGSIWLGTPGGLNRLLNRHVTVYGGGSALAEKSVERGLSVIGAVTKNANNGLAGAPGSLGLDDQGRLWVSSGDGLFYFEGGRFVRVPTVASRNIFGIAGGGHGNMWVSGDNAGLLYVTPVSTVQSNSWSRLGHKGYGARALLPDPWQSGVWLGFYEGGVVYVKDGETVRSYGATDGLGNGRVNQLRFGSRMPRAVWAATEGGLSRIKDDHIETLSSKNGLPCDEVHWSVEDDDHAMWVYMPCGLARIERSEWYAWIDDPRHVIKTTLFDSSDGVPGLGIYGGYGPHMTKSPDGKIWFVTGDGVSVIDPRHLSFNKLPPPVHIEQITADHKSYYDLTSDGTGEEPASEGGHFGKGRVRLPAVSRDLQIDYTALSLAAPEKVLFRYKLEGYDRDWVDAGNRRQAFYTNLPPKNYTFRVIACNNSGVWNEVGAFVDFSVDPAYYQTNWFRALLFAVFLGLSWAFYQIRLRRMAREFNAGLEARVNERTRIARELHDTLLQSFQGLLMRFQAVSNELDEGEPKQELDEAINRAARAITEGRDAVQGLRSSAMESNDLAAAIGALAKELPAADSRSPEFTVQVEGAVRKLHPVLRDEVYRVAGEALRNAFHHADAEHIEVEIRYDERRFRLRVRDDGKGIDPKHLAGNGRAGHFGLHGMRERAQRVGGKLTVWSSDPRTDGGLQSGTEVELSIPAARAYKAVDAAGRGSWLARKLSSKDRETGS